MSAIEMSHVSGASSESEDEEIDIDSATTDRMLISTDCYRCHRHQEHRHGNQLQQPGCIARLLSSADQPRFVESDDIRIRKLSGDRMIDRSESDLDSLSKQGGPCSDTELRSLLSPSAEHRGITSEKRLFSSPPSVTDRSPSSSASSSSSSSSAVSPPPSSPPHKKHHHRPSTIVVPSLDNPSPLSLASSDDANQPQRRRRPLGPSSVAVSAMALQPPRSAPAPVTNFFIEEILKPSFGVSTKSVQSKLLGFKNTWGTRSCATEDRVHGLSPRLLATSELPPVIPAGLPSQIYEKFTIARVNAQETEDASDRKHVTKKRKLSKSSDVSCSDRFGFDLQRFKVDSKESDRRCLSSSRAIEGHSTRSIDFPFRRQSSPINGKYDATPLHHQTDGNVFKLVTCSSSNNNNNDNNNGSNHSNNYNNGNNNSSNSNNGNNNSNNCNNGNKHSSNSNNGNNGNSHCNNSNAPPVNDCSNSSSSSSSSSSQASASLSEDNIRRSEDSDQQQFQLSDPSSASSMHDSSCAALQSHQQQQQQQLPAWVYCTRYSDRPSSGPRSRKVRHTRRDTTVDEKRPRTAFTNDQLQILKREFSANQYLNEDRRHALATKLNLNETQIKIWFQNKRAKLKKASGIRNRLALELMAQGLYNHSTVTATGDCV